MHFMRNLALSSCLVVMAPLVASAATVVAEGGGPYDVTSDVLFTGIAQSSADGAGSYTIDFFTPGNAVLAIADAAVTQATIDTSFTDLTMSWIDGLNLNVLVAATGVDTITTAFDTSFPTQQLRFDWTDSNDQAGFRFDVATQVAPVPVPASFLLLGSTLAAFGFFARRRRSGTAAV